MSNIILCGGGTAGHIMPNIALLPHLRKYYDNIYYVGGADSLEKKIAEDNNLPFFATEVAKLERNKLFSNMKIPFKLLKGINQAKEIIDKCEPNIIFCKGGYVTLPIAYAAKFRKIPVICHESDMTLGLANKRISKFAKATFTSYSNTIAHNSVYTGIPIRDSLKYGNAEHLRRKYDLSDKPTLLIVGGSQGAKAINECILKCIEDLLPRFNVIHITGKTIIKPFNKYHICLNYTDNIADYYALANIVVSRAGATSCAELCYLEKKTVLIPLPKGSSRGDQLLNAKYYEDNNSARVLQQNEMTPISLYNIIVDTYNNFQQADTIKPADCAKIARLIVEYNL